MTESQKKAIALQQDYQMFRINFLLFFVMVNYGYVVLIDGFVKKQNEIANDGVNTFIDVFTYFLCGMVYFKFFFGFLHIMKMKITSHLFAPDQIDLRKFVKKMKKDNDLDASDDEKDNKLGVDDFMEEMAAEEMRHEKENDLKLAQEVERRSTMAKRPQ